MLIYILTLNTFIIHAADAVTVIPERESRQLVVRHSENNGPPRRLHLPGNGNENINSKLQNGPLTLHNGRLKPVATIEMVDKNAEIDFEASSDRQMNVRRPGSVGKILQKMPAPIRRNGNRTPARGRPSVFFPQHNRPFNFMSNHPVVGSTGDGDFTSDFSAGDTSNRNHRPQDNDASPSETLLDWSTKVSASKNGQQKLNLDTKYFTITRPDDKESSTPDPGLTYIVGKPGLVLRKVKGRMKTSTSRTSTTEQISSSTEDNIDRVATDTENIILIIDEDLSEENETMSTKSFLPDYSQLLKHFKKEFWVIPVVAASGLLVLVLVIFEIYLLSRTINRNPSRRHLFLGQMLLLGLLSCACMATVYTLRPTVLSCASLRLGTGLAYSLVYSTLLVKLVFLISLNSGVYLPATYQSLLLCFAILIQLVIGIQWLVTSPPNIVDINEALEDKAPHIVCATEFQQQLLGLLYVVFLIIVVVVLSFKVILASHWLI